MYIRMSGVGPGESMNRLGMIIIFSRNRAEGDVIDHCDSIVSLKCRVNTGNQ